MNKKLMFFCIFFVLLVTVFPATITIGKNVTSTLNYQKASLHNIVSFNNPPEKPYIEGRVDGIPNTWYEFRFSSIDPDGDTLTIFVDWGDGQNESIQTISGQIKFLYHAWYKTGDYTIRAQATDEHGAKSEWATSPMHMPKSKLINNLFLNYYIKFPQMCNIIFSRTSY